MARHSWRVFGTVGVFALALLGPAGGEPDVLVGDQTAPSAEASSGDRGQTMAPSVVMREGFLLAGVSDRLAKRITSAQDAAGPAFTIAIDGGQVEPLAVSPDRLRDFRNVYYRIIGQAGAWRLEERGFSATGADDESKLVRRGLGVSLDKRIYFIPGREYVLIPAKSNVVLSAGGERWDFRAKTAPGAESATRRATILAAGQTVPLDLVGPLSTASTSVGALVVLTISQDVVADGLVVLDRGTPVEARVVGVSRPDALGNPGMLVLELGLAKAVDGSDVPLAGPHSQQISFRGSPGAFCFIRARHLELPSGTRTIARVSSRIAILAPVPERPGAARAAPEMGWEAQTP